MHNKDCNDYTEYCLEKRKDASDEVLVRFYSCRDEWLKQIPLPYVDTVKTLMNNIVYFTHKEVNEFFPLLHRKLLENSIVTNDNTVYAFITSKKGHSNSSINYWTEYTLINSISKCICYVNLNKINEVQWSHIDNIVYIDDFSGSGSSFISEVNLHSELFVGKNIFFVTIGIMDQAIHSISSYAKKTGFKFIPVFIIKQEKAFAGKLFADNENARMQIESMSKYFGICDDYSMGYKGTEALIAFYNNTPNNTLGFIWWNKAKSYIPLLNRNEDERPSWYSLKSGKSNRDSANYNNALHRGR